MEMTFLASFYSGDSWMYPYQRTPMGNHYMSPISTMGTLLGVHPIVPWFILFSKIHIPKITHAYSMGGATVKSGQNFTMSWKKPDLQMGVSKNSDGPPQIIHLFIGFSMK